MSENEIKGILGKKLGMTQIFDEDNRVVPVTVVEAGPCVVTQVRTKDTDGYEAVQIAFGDIDPRKVKKPQAGHYKKAGVTPRRHMVEFRVDDASAYEDRPGGRRVQPAPDQGCDSRNQRRHRDRQDRSEGRCTRMSNLTLNVHTADGSTNGTVELPASIFDVEPSVPLMHQVVVAQLAAKRQGTHATKTRGMVSGGGKKPFRQKGTGRARQGSTRAPHFTGGGTVHGPQPRDYDQRTPKKMKAAALRGALTDRVRNERIHLVEELVAGQTPSTKSARTFIERLTDRRSVLVVLGRDDVTAWKSVNNLSGVHALAADQLNTYDVLNADDVIFSVEALNTFVEQSSRKEEAK
ncbi:hypothetical protein KR044_001972 [Drosophila immigrans]|nr:hypothetical protein KR044_001972 [Drosophila immigrans]